MSEKVYLSAEMHLLTERGGEIYNRDAAEIIADRYKIASQLAVGRDVLEVGVGQGYGIDAISRASTSYLGLEYSLENIELIRRSDNRPLRIARGDGEKLPLRDGSVDLVCALAMVYYMNLERFAGEAHRVLRDGGALFFDASNPSLQSFTPSPYAVEYNDGEEILRKLKNAGFDVKLYGAFPESTGLLSYPLIRIKLARMVRKFLKAVLPGTRIWTVIRNSYYGGAVTLPSSYQDLCDRFPRKTELVQLPEFSHGERFRVIYCYATKM